MSEKIVNIGEEKITKLLLHFSVPATVGLLVAASYNMVDTIFIGRLGSEAIAALSMAFPLQMLLGAFGIGTGVGAASLISRSLGAGNKEDAERAVGQIVTLSLFCGLIAALLGFFYLRPLLIFLGTTPDILQLTEDYMSVITTGAGAFFLIMTLNNTVRAEGNPVLSMKVMIISALVNIALDPIFIFVLDMGVRGAAIATVISKSTVAAIMLYYFLWGKSVLKLRTASLKPHLETIRNIYQIGFPAMLLKVSNNISLIIANFILAGYGHIPIAVMGLAFRLQMFASMPVFGISQGILPIIGFNYGAEKLQRIRETLVKAITVSTVIITFAAVVFLLKPVFFLRLFSSETELLAIGSEALRILVIMFPVMGFQVISTVFFQAIGKGLPSLILSLLREVLLFIPILLLISAPLGLTGIWASRPISDLLAFLITFVMISRELKDQGIPLFNSQITHSEKC